MLGLQYVRRGGWLYPGFKMLLPGTPPPGSNCIQLHAQKIFFEKSLSFQKLVYLCKNYSLLKLTIMMLELIEFAELLKRAGFTVFVYKYDNANYFSFTNGNGFGYVQYERLGGPFSFVHKHTPNRQTGTGFGIDTNGMLTIENANHVCNTPFPAWATPHDRHASKQYKSIDDFLSLNKDCSISTNTITN